MVLGTLPQGARAAACATLEVTRDPQGIEIRWNSSTGHVYRLDSASALIGPWLARQEVTATGAVSAWRDATAPDAGTRFYRLALVNPPTCDGLPATNAVTSAQVFLASDTLPIEIGTVFQDSRQTAAEAVSLASLRAGTGGLVTTGRITQEGAGWIYAAEPADRLIIQYIGLPALELRIQRMEGDFTGNAAQFLDRNHVFEWQAASPGIGDVAFTSRRQGRLIEATTQGTYIRQGVTYQLNLTARADYFFESSFGGAQTLNDVVTTGTLATAGFTLQVGYRNRFELVSGGGTASTTEEWISHTLTAGNDVYTWRDVKKQKSFSDGFPSDVNNYWDARGEVLRNGAPFARYTKRLDPVAGVGTKVVFAAETPAGPVELESWNVVPRR